MYLEKVKKRFKELNLISPDEIEPCTEEDVHKLEQHLGIILPAAYKEFLYWMGRGAGRLQRGSRFFYGHLWDIKKVAVNLLDENEVPESLSDDAFVFYMHQGYQFAFLRASEGDDPPVYYYGEELEGNAIIKSHPSYSEFLLSTIEKQLALIAELGPLPPGV
jgi:SMI1/KNR4 family protein SUKH-1